MKIFTARSRRLTESMYIGCHINTEARLSMPKPGSVPLIIVAGVQKGAEGRLLVHARPVVAAGTVPPGDLRAPILQPRVLCRSGHPGG